MRYRLLETVREYAGERLGREAGGARDAHAAYFTALAEEAAPHLVRSREADWGVRIRAEGGNVSAALAWTIESGAVERGLRLATGLHYYWLDRDHLQEGNRLLETLLARPGEVAQGVRARALLVSSNFLSIRGDEEGAKHRATAALELFREIGDRAGVAWALVALAVIDESRGAYAEGRWKLEEALPLYRAAGDEFGVRRTLHLLGNAARETGDLGRARELLREAVELARGDPFHAAAIRHALGDVELEAGNVPAARETYLESLAEARELAAHRVGCYCIAALAATEGSRELWGIAEALERSLAFRMRPASRARYERRLAAGRTPGVALDSPDGLIQAALGALGLDRVR